MHQQGANRVGAEQVNGPSACSPSFLTRQTGARLGARKATTRWASLDAAFDLNLGRAGRTYEDPSFDRRQKPDWALCSVDRKSPLSDGSFRYDNLLPGDSKLSNKWHSSWYQRSDLHPGYLQVWKDPVRQILSYCRHNRCRYGFLITDAELVVMRVTPMPTAESSVTTRQASQAEALAAHYRHISTSTTMSSLSSSLRDMSLDSSSSYRPNDLAEDGYIVEYTAPSLGEIVDSRTLRFSWVCSTWLGLPALALTHLNSATRALTRAGRCLMEHSSTTLRAWHWRRRSSWSIRTRRLKEGHVGLRPQTDSLS
ncbi:uncharacterized protein THITE_2121688 [Thermothielavioides terrestris NRRL 8126]|uniref:Uncharacterized protein n=1 Tax=Thermothielavioides terrestris (strain ATCC 38088 / NRRL 8126) TaxID=578455 RepID=G2RF75_THETT|nr:uncharacterized protein THITE_2121688 [Thermothielavioides terrestris NRRL 8126]AEO70358.1 hypothetical protein THITE_2121688 [Thermothielavioides terrestris NRRL 8126]